MVVHMRDWMLQRLGISGSAYTPILYIFYVHIIKVDPVSVGLFAVFALLCSSLIKSE